MFEPNLALIGVAVADIGERFPLTDKLFAFVDEPFAF